VAVFVAALGISAGLLMAAPAGAETIFGAHSKADENNSSLNSARAGVRVTDENVPIARSGMRPSVVARGSAAYSSSRVWQFERTLATGSFGIVLSQSIFDGFQTRNNVRAAEARVRAARENLRNTEQNTLFDAASAYMDVILFRRIAELRQQNLEFLSEQVRAARSRFEVGEGTRTDVAQAEASRSAAQAQLTAARAQATSAEAVYRQIVGAAPGRLQAAAPLSKLLPASLDGAYARAESEHPAIAATKHVVDASGFEVKSAEGKLLPSLSAEVGVEFKDQNTSPPAATDGSGYSTSVGATLTIPIYQGGLVSSTVRKSKETLGQARIDVDVSRDQVRAAVASAWTQYEAARRNVEANRELVAALRLALDGVIAEREVGLRTTLDVLNAQADVITAQVDQASAERDVVVASYAIVSATGRLTARHLGLKVELHKPEEHFEAVKDKWFGLRTPDGR
jgi:outer membrane protein